MAKNLDLKNVQDNELKGQLDFNNSIILEESDSDSEFTQQDSKLNKNKVDKHSRTPSGTNLTDIVQDIRTIFSTVEKPKRKRQESGDSPNNSTNISSQNNASLTKLLKRSEGQAVRPSGTNKTNSTNHNTNFSMCDNHDNSDTQLAQKGDDAKTQHQHQPKQIDIEDIKDPTHEELKIISQQMNRQLTEDADIKEDELQDQEPNHEEEMETNAATNPQARSLTTVQQMFTDLKMQMDDLKSSVQKIEERKTHQMDQSTINKCVSKVIQKANSELSVDPSQITKMKEDIKHLKFQNRTLTNVVQRYNVELEEIRQRMENIEVASAKRALTISGLFIDKKKEDGIDQIQTFIREYLELDVLVEDYYKMGANDPKLLVVYFQSIYDKRQIMKYKKYLKDVKNKEGKEIFISDYTPAATMEKRKREQQIKQQNEELPTPAKISYPKGRLAIQNETYVPKVAPLTPKDLVDLSPKEVDDILKMSLEAGPPITMDKSIFEGYTASVQNYQEIRNLYVKI